MRDLFKNFTLLPTLCVLFITTSASHAKPVDFKDEENVRETVFLYQFSHNASALKQKAKAYYLTIGTNGADPSDNLLKRFAGHKPPVFKISKLKPNNKKEIDGLTFKITNLRWISETEVEVTGGYYEGPLSSSGGIYRVKKHNGKWIVLNYQEQWIS